MGQRVSTPPLTGAKARDFILLAAGAFSLMAAIAAQGGRVSARLDLLAEIAPVWLACALLTLALGGLFARGRLRLAVLIIGAAGMLAAGSLIWPEIAHRRSPPAGPRDGPRITLIEFNTWDRNADIRQTAAWIGAQHPDLVLIAEAEAPISDALAAQGFERIQGIGHVAIFSHAAPGPNPVRISIPQWHELPPFARATFGAGEGRYSVFAVHLTRPTLTGAAASRTALTSLLGRYDQRRLIVAGDFNMTPWSFGLRRFDERIGLERRDLALFSWPGKLTLGGKALPVLPILPIDHVYAGADWRTVSVKRGPALGSDHFPVVATLALTGGAAGP
jgi:endonuclease/exonuclease/phosphatase (EEP) superfamily protein YafD